MPKNNSTTTNSWGNGPWINWTLYTPAESLDCQATGNYAIYRADVSIKVDLTTICSIGGGHLPPDPLYQDVRYEIIEAEPNEFGEYELYPEHNLACAINLFSLECFDHHHGEEDVPGGPDGPGGTGGGGRSSGHDELEEIHFLSTLTTTCEGYGIEGESTGEGSLISNPNGHTDRIHRNDKSVSNHNEFYPNPFKNAFSWNCHTDIPTEVSINVYSLDQRLLIDRTYQHPGGKATFEVPASGLVPGIYLVRTWDGKHYQTTKLLKTLKQ